MNELEFFDGTEDAATAGFRRILVTEADHPYAGAWWPPGHGLGYEHTFVHEVADLVRDLATGTAPGAVVRRRAAGAARARRRRALGRRGQLLGGDRGMRPVTLFTGQWADLPFEEVARLAGEWGYDGLEIACWGDHLDVVAAAEDPAYVQGRRDILEKHGLQVFAISNHLAGQAVCDDPIDERHRASCPTGCGATASRRACGSARRRR
jgi:hypothetical protein